MTSERKIAANRKNSRKSCGPRTAAGKSKASRNALRHGLAAITHRPPARSAEIEQFARSLCGDDDDPALLKEARAIAESEVALRIIRMQQIAVIERLREASAIALANGDNSIELGRTRQMQSWVAYLEVKQRVPALLHKYRYQTLAGDTSGANIRYVEPVPLELMVLIDPVSEEEEQLALKRARTEIEERDEHEALKAAVPDLRRLERYERRAQTRQRQAIRRFIEAKFREADCPRSNSTHRLRGAAL
jgi:hypothetical protein